MFPKLVTIGKVETRRLAWVIAALFAVVVALQYFELPYGSFLSTSASTRVVPDQEKSSMKKGSETVSNYTGTSGVVQGKGNETKSSSFDDDNRGGDADSRLGILVKQNSTSETKNESNVDNGLAKEETREPGQGFGLNISAMYNETTMTISEAPSPSPDVDVLSLLPVTPPASSPSYISEPILDKNESALAITGNYNTSSVEKENENEISTNDEEKERPKDVQGDQSRSEDFPPPPMASDPKIQKPAEKPVLDVYSLLGMDDLLSQSRDSYYSVKPSWSSTVDRELKDAESQIDNAPIVTNDRNLYAPLFRNVSTFKRSYELMEKILKVYVYKEGERPILHTPYLRGLYASEGWFMKQLESNKKFVTKNPKNAHLFYLPFSSRRLEETLYVVDSHSHKNLIQYLKNYVGLIAGKYPYWNRTSGADHFLVACHDWAPSETNKIMAKCIRAICNSDVKEGFVFGKDVSLPETYVRMPKNPLRDLGGNPLSKRSTLAFFAGSMHGYVRPILLQHWENKDPDMKIFGKLPKVKGNKVYLNYMKSSKYCICAKGYEVNSPRVVEAIFYECVPVIISDNFVPPFFGVLNWESFSVFVAEKDIPDLKKILSAIPEKRYREMQMNVKRVQQHFLWHAKKPVKYDIFHMILHSIWYNRLHQIRPDN